MFSFPQPVRPPLLPGGQATAGSAGDWILGDHLGSPAELGSEVAHGSSCPGRIHSPPTPGSHLLHPQIDSSGFLKKKIKFGKSHLSFRSTASCKAPLPPPLPLLWKCGPHPAGAAIPGSWSEMHSWAPPRAPESSLR